MGCCKKKKGKKPGKKADLSLSVNSIVILIIAITVLGLGLVFVRGLFKQATGKITTAIDLGDLTNPPNADDPLTVTPKNLDIRQGKQDIIVVNFMNSYGSGMYCKFLDPDYTPSPVASCMVPPSVTLNTNCYSYNKDQVNQYKLGVTAKSLVTKTAYSKCTSVTQKLGSSSQGSLETDDGLWSLTMKVACFNDKAKCETFKGNSPDSKTAGFVGLAIKDLTVQVSK